MVSTGENQIIFTIYKGGLKNVRFEQINYYLISISLFTGPYNPNNKYFNDELIYTMKSYGNFKRKTKILL